jgi:hypothetical protein
MPDNETAFALRASIYSPRALSRRPKARSTVGTHKDVDVDERINALAQSLADRFGERALDVVIRQFDAADGDVKQVWGRIMEWLILHKEEGGKQLDI